MKSFIFVMFATLVSYIAFFVTSIVFNYDENKKTQFGNISLRRKDIKRFIQLILILITICYFVKYLSLLATLKQITDRTYRIIDKDNNIYYTDSFDITQDNKISFTVEKKSLEYFGVKCDSEADMVYFEKVDPKQIYNTKSKTAISVRQKKLEKGFIN